MTTNVGSTSTAYGQPVNAGTTTNITATSAGIQVKAGSGVLYSVVFNNPVATGVITLYDGTSTSGTVMGTITIPSSPQPVSLRYDAYFNTGLFVSIATAAQDVTFVYR